MNSLHDALVAGEIDLNGYLWGTLEAYFASPGRIAADIRYAEAWLEKKKIELEEAQAMPLSLADQIAKREFADFSAKLQGWRAEADERAARLQRHLDQVLDMPLPDEVKQRAVDGLQESIYFVTWSHRTEDGGLDSAEVFKERLVRRAESAVKHGQDVLANWRRLAEASQRLYDEMQKVCPR